MTRPTKRFVKWFERYGMVGLYEKLSLAWIDTQSVSRAISLSSAIRQLAWRAYQRGRRDQQEENRKVMEFLCYSPPEDSPYYTGKRR
jgi:hypothetical protein